MNAVFDTAFITSAEPSEKIIWGYDLSFTNTGSIPITVTNYWWKIPFKRERASTIPQLDPEVADLSTILPKKISHSESGNIFHNHNFFLNMKSDFLYSENKLVACIRIHFFKVYVSTSVGKHINVKVSRLLRSQLWTEYKKTNSKQ